MKLIRRQKWITSHKTQNFKFANTKPAFVQTVTGHYQHWGPSCQRQIHVHESRSFPEKCDWREELTRNQRNISSDDPEAACCWILVFLLAADCWWPAALGDLEDCPGTVEDVQYCCGKHSISPTSSDLKYLQVSWKPCCGTSPVSWGQETSKWLTGCFLCHWN